MRSRVPHARRSVGVREAGGGVHCANTRAGAWDVRGGRRSARGGGGAHRLLFGELLGTFGAPLHVAIHPRCEVVMRAPAFLSCTVLLVSCSSREQKPAADSPATAAAVAPAPAPAVTPISLASLAG